MSTESLHVVSKPMGSEELSQLAARYGIVPSHLVGAFHGLYERHLLFDNDVDPYLTNAREHYEAFARSVRDILSQRWVVTNRPTIAPIPNAFTTSPWNFSSAARSPTM